MGYFDRTTKRLYLPSDATLWVDVYAELTWKDAKVHDEAEDDIKRTDAILPLLIKEWNLTDGEAVAPIDAEHINKLKNSDIGYISTEIAKLIVASRQSDEQKKSSSKKPTKP